MADNAAHRRAARKHQKTTGDSYTRSLRQVDSRAGGGLDGHYRWRVSAKFDPVAASDREVQAWTESLGDLGPDEGLYCGARHTQMWAYRDDFPAVLALLARAHAVIGAGPAYLLVSREVLPGRHKLLRRLVQRRIAAGLGGAPEDASDEWAESSAALLEFLPILIECGLDGDDDKDYYVSKPWKWSFEHELWELAGSPTPPHNTRQRLFLLQWMTPEAWNHFEELVQAYWDDPATFTTAMGDMFYHLRTGSDVADLEPDEEP
jgi:hypothetical protein